MKARVVLSLALLGLLPAPVAEPSSGAEAVGQKPLLLFRGFDRRLEATPIGRIPDLKDRVVGFEVLRGRPVVAHPHRLLEFRGNAIAAIPSLEVIESLVLTDRAEMFVQNSRGVRRWNGRSFETVAAYGGAGQLHGSGTSTLLESGQRDGGRTLAVRRADGTGLLLARPPEAPRALAWNSVGLAAVVGDGLFAWTAGGSSVRLLAADEGLRLAQDVCLVGEGRAVVSLKHATVLLTTDGGIVIVGFGGRCRWSDGTLYLLDEARGVIWAVRELDTLGNAGRDREHARLLVRGLPANAAESDSKFLEAARIVGLEEARRWR